VAGRIVLFGATGYTGKLTAQAMVERGLRPVLAARSRPKLEALAEELGGRALAVAAAEPGDGVGATAAAGPAEGGGPGLRGPLETAVADVSDPPSVRALVEEGDVLVTTVGPFVRWGSAAAAAATTAGAHYLDSTGEPPFIREVFERYGPAAERVGCGLLTAFGFDWVPGNLAGGIALDRAGESAVRIDVGYFTTGSVGVGAMSGGTKASLVGVIAAPSFSFTDGRVRSERGAKSLRQFSVEGRDMAGVSVGSSEHFTLPRVAPQLREVNSYLGWFGPASRAMQVASGGMSLAFKVPGLESVWKAAGGKLVQGSTGGPDEAERSRTGSHVVAIAYDDAGRQLSEVHVTGVDGYTFTGRMLAWGAERAAAGALKGTGALGPVDGFGLADLIDGCGQAGIAETGEPGSATAPAKDSPHGASQETAG
jgi:short subunit dehydrogenase-like uncharacterized protein